jgi:3-isopropylmalate/(R)-2-methylmalate dehydratase large subunit
MGIPDIVRLTPGKRILFLTKDPELIRRQIAGELDLRMADLEISHLLDDINTDVMTPAWVCFSYRPEDISREAYAGLIVGGKRLIPSDALANGNFEVIVSGYRKGVGSSRETAVQAEKWSGIRIAIAASFAPIHAANNINQGVLMGDHEVLVRLQDGAEVPLSDFYRAYDRLTQLKVMHGGLFAFSRALAAGEIETPPVSAEVRPMTMAEKILAAHALGEPASVSPGDPLVARVDGGYSHEFTTAQVHHFLEQEVGPDYSLDHPESFAVFEDHLIYADEVPRMRPFLDKIEKLRDLQRQFQRHTGVQDFSARDGVSPGICHEVARERLVAPGQFILATEPHRFGPDDGGGPAVHSIRAHRQPAGGRHRQGPDALYPLALRQAAEDSQPSHGVRRPRARVAVDGRESDTDQHGHRVFSPGRHCGGR